MQTALDHDCVACPLAETRHVIVEGHGSLTAEVLAIGEGPGGQEDLSGTPFVGQSGKLLRYTLAKVLAQLGLRNVKVRFTNAVRCRPPDNRDPLPNELAACQPWLVEELDAMPNLRVVMALGKYGKQQAERARTILSLEDERWTDLQIEQVFHPAYILRQRKHTADWEADIRRILRRVFGLPEPILNVPPWQIVGGISDIDLTSPYLSADTEFDDLDEHTDGQSTLVGFSLSDGTRTLFQEGRLPVRPEHLWLHNAKADLEHLDIDPYDFTRWDDTMLGIYVLRQHDRVGLKEAGPRVTGIHWKHTLTTLLKERVPLPTIKRSAKHKDKWADIPIPFSRALDIRRAESTEYAATDSIVTARMAEYVTDEFRKQPWARAYYEKYEKPLVPVLLKMERVGVRIDLDALGVARAEIQTHMREQENVLYELEPALRDVSLSAPQQLAPLFSKWEIIDGKLTSTGHLGTAKGNILGAFDVEKLEQIPQEDDRGRLAVAYLQWKADQKLESTYGSRLEYDARRDPLGRIHPRFNGAATDTDRLSSSDPNAQNIPTRGRVGAAIRRAFRARAGYVLVVGDYSQLELRIWAYITQDPFFLGAFVGDNVYDPHQRSSELLIAAGFSVPRGDAKNTNFAALYGADDPKLAATAHVPIRAATAFGNQLRALAPSLGTHREDTRRQLESRGFVRTLLDWRGFYPLFMSPIPSERAAAIRAAGNMRIQGTASGIVKDFMIEWDYVLRTEFPESFLLLQVHDELVNETPEKDADRMERRLKEVGDAIGRKWLSGAGRIAVPLSLSVDVGPNWADAKPH